MNSSTNHPLSASFVEAQRLRLIALRAQLMGTGDAAGAEERLLQDTAGGEAGESEDDAEKMAIQENDEAVFHQSVKRLDDVRRALEKIDEGTYGLSDDSGDPISKARLEAVPEAIYTVDEERDHER
ncbi:TraR/DksA family transcriptional regulator [Luteibacter rhizovicinus]|uniref:TraR/DksA family transcriptional regulator n=1 Tax=Luteibacter rhizovicinus TaxID=242606 RepID=A0A4R3Z1D9_9GAMM|nr:TraR/DksA family transcriptional regulator [Luteibacter rhizovicinus]TCV97664.1 TraR/DksA family transcriptional regulator [Luteibacter rhizovicinus]